MHIRLKTSQNGDTIVEVLIAMVIIGLILVISFLAVNNSTSSNRRSQERSEALQLLVNQVEDLRYIATNGQGTAISQVPAITSGAVAFCITNNNTVSAQFPPFTPTTDLSMFTLPMGAAGCAVSPNGPGTQPQYYIELTVDPTNSESNDYAFKATAVWEAVGKSSNDTTNIDYRIDL